MRARPYFNRREQQKVTERILSVARAQLRADEGRDPEPSAGIVDSQSVKGADTVGLLPTTMARSASVQDRDGAKSVLLDVYLRTRVRFVASAAGLAASAAGVV